MAVVLLSLMTQKKGWSTLILGGMQFIARNTPVTAAASQPSSFTSMYAL